MSEDRRAEAEARYISGRESIKALAAALEISDKTVAAWCKAGGWVKKRQKFQARTAKKALTIAANKKARELAKLLEASDEMETALLHAARAFSKALEEEPQLVTDGKFRSGNLRNVAESIQRQAQTRMMISGILERKDAEKLKIMQNKQALEERKAAQGQENGGAIRVVIEPSAEKLAE